MRAILGKPYSSFSYIKRWAERSPESVTIQNLKQSEGYNRSYLKTIVSNEVKNRIAGQIIGLESLPFGISKTPTINDIIVNYIKSFNDMKHPTDSFDKTLQDILDRHKDVMKEMAIGIHEWKHDMKQKYDLDNFNDFTDKIDNSLNDFYHKRMSTRLIISNYLSIENTGHSIIDSDINIPRVIDDAYEDAKLLCNTKYNMSPGIDIKSEFDGNFMYIQANLYYIIHELLKNSLEAVVLRHKCRSEMPKISVRLNENKGRPILRIHDEGVGVSTENLNAIWSYFYSTSTNSIQNIHTKDELDEFIKTPAISGFGYGLPLCNMFMEYFGGRITFNSVVGSCSDVYLYF